MKWPVGRALILAAGKGTRLLPVTKSIPKPLFPVLGVPAVERITKLLSVPEIRQTAINVFHLKDQLIKWSLSRNQKGQITILEEKVLLGTGGAVKNAFEQMGYEWPLLIYNGDVISNLDPSRLLRCYFDMGSPPSLLCVHDRAPFNKLHIEHGQVISFDGHNSSALAYSGISVISPELLRDYALRPYSLVDIWKEAIEDGQSIKTVSAHEVTTQGESWIWEDLGTPCGYLHGNWTLLSRTKSHRFISSKALLGKNLELKGKIFIGAQAVIGDNTTIKDSIIWPGVRIKEDTHIENCTVTPYGTLQCHCP